MTAATDPLLDAVRSLVARVAGPSRTPAESGPGTPLSGGGFWLDSVELPEALVDAVYRHAGGAAAARLVADDAV